MATLRSTLTYAEDSMLAARFSGRWDDSIAKDKRWELLYRSADRTFSPHDQLPAP